MSQIIEVTSLFWDLDDNFKPVLEIEVMRDDLSVHTEIISMPHVIKWVQIDLSPYINDAMCWHLLEYLANEPEQFAAKYSAPIIELVQTQIHQRSRKESFVVDQHIKNLLDSITSQIDENDIHIT